MNVQLDIVSSALPSTTRVVAFSGEEALSELYQFVVVVAMDAADSRGLELEELLGKPVALELTAPGTEPERYHGCLAEAALLEEEGEWGVYELHIRPRLWELTLSHHSRIFTDMTLPQIINRVLKEAGFTARDYELVLSGAYTIHEHVCQLRESNYDFLARWMAREGVYFFFRHDGDQEKLIITDGYSQHRDLPAGDALWLHHARGGFGDGQVLESFAEERRGRPATVELFSRAHLHPTLDLKVTKSVTDGTAGEIRVRDQGYIVKEEGERVAGARSQALAAGATAFRGRGCLLGIRPGYPLEVEEHLRTAVRGRYVVRQVIHRGLWTAAPEVLRVLDGRAGSEPVYLVELDALAESLQYRPAPREWPRVTGVVNGLIDGEAESDYAQIDENGRYRLRFFFDESGLPGGHATAWIRMMQPHGGEPEGWHFPLRKNTEVLVAFQDGDPDQPVILGAVNDADTPSPVTAANHTMNIFQTGGRNLLEMEDASRKERAYLYSPVKESFLHLGCPKPRKNFHYINATQGNQLLEFGGDFQVEVGGTKFEHVVGTVTENYDADQATKITGTQKSIVDGGVEEIYRTSQKTTITGPLTLTVTKKVTKTLASENKTVDGLVDEAFQATLETTSPVVLSQFKSLTETIGPVKWDYGPVIANWKSLDLTLTNASTISAPGGWTHLNPQHKETTTTSSWFSGVWTCQWSMYDTKHTSSINLFGVKGSVGGLEAQCAVLTAALTGSKSGTHGLALSAGAAAFDKAGLKLLKGGTKNIIAGLLILTG